MVMMDTEKKVGKHLERVNTWYAMIGSLHLFFLLKSMCCYYFPHVSGAHLGGLFGCHDRPLCTDGTQN